MTQQLSARQLIPVAFISGNTFRKLGQTKLPALPNKGDFLALGTLAYQVTGRSWRLTPDGRVDILIVLVPLPDENGEWPTAYPEEKELPVLWETLANATQDLTS